jgi:nitrate/nitrite transport system substrate-binding protein
MIFSNRDCNYPQPAFGLWWISQFRRWGMVKQTPDYQGVVKRALRPDIYLEAMKEINVTPNIATHQKITFGDSTTFDASDPETYAKSFAIHSRVVT